MNSIEEYSTARRIDRALDKNPDDAGAIPELVTPSNLFPEKPLVSGYSIIPQILVYPFVAFALMLMWQSFGDWEAFGFFTVCFLLFMIPVWFISARVRLDRSGIHMSRLFGAYRREVEWRQVERVEPARMGAGMRLIASQGRPLTISSQMSGYSHMIEISRTLRPDLFRLPEISPGDASGSKTFQKGAMGKYWLLCCSIVFSIAFLATLATAQIVPAMIVAVILYFFWVTALSAVHTVTLEGNRLTVRSFRTRQAVTAQEIKNIGLTTRYNRRGVATHFIQLELPDASTIEFTGFPEGNELMYGFLKSWWNVYQNA